jgi:hypothetical protein
MKYPAVCVSCPFNFLVFYAVGVLSKESRRVVLPRNSCLYYEITLLSVTISVYSHTPNFFRLMKSLC